MGRIMDAAQRLEDTLLVASADAEYDPGVQNAMSDLLDLLKGVERHRTGETFHRHGPQHFHYFQPHAPGFEICVEDPRERGSIGCGVIREAGSRLSSYATAATKGESDGLYRSCPWCGNPREAPQVERERKLAAQ